MTLDGLDQEYTPEDYLHHIEARNRFSIEQQPTTPHEYKFWNARRIVFTQCSLTGTALSWYLHLNDAYKQDWSAFVQVFKKQLSSRKKFIMRKLKPLLLLKRITKQYAILPSKFNN